MTHLQQAPPIPWQTLHHILGTLQGVSAGYGANTAPPRNGTIAPIATSRVHPASRHIGPLQLGGRFVHTAQRLHHCHRTIDIVARVPWRTPGIPSSNTSSTLGRPTASTTTTDTAHRHDPAQQRNRTRAPRQPPQFPAALPALQAPPAPQARPPRAPTAHWQQSANRRPYRLTQKQHNNLKHNTTPTGRERHITKQL